MNARDDAEALLWCFPDRVLIVGGVATMPWSIALERVPIRILGACCAQDGCSELARWQCFWPGQSNAACDHHKLVAERLANVFAFEIVSRPLDVPVGLDDTEQRFSLLELD